MNRTRTRLAAVAFAALLAPNGAGAKTLVLVEQSIHPLVVHETAETLVPLPFFPLPQPQHGASLLLNSVVHAETQEGPVVGVMHGQCTTIGSSQSAPGEEQDPETFMMQCTHTLRIDGRGTLVLTGLSNQREFEGSEAQCFTDGLPQALAVVGGTGEFRKSRGEAEVRALPNFPGCTVGCASPEFCRPGAWKRILLTLR